MAGLERLPKSLPPEIWSQILDCIPRFESRYLLNVCSQFHDNIIRQLFSSIKIYFIGGDKGKKMLNTFYEDFTRETAEKLMRKSWEILNRISRDRQFAKVVKNITVVAYAEGLGIFERLSVANIFQYLPNLHTFRWVGCHPAFDDEIAEYLPFDLKTLDVQSTFPLDSLQHLTQLTTLRLPIPFLFPEDDEAMDRLVEDTSLIEHHSTISIQDIFENFPSTLQCLRICASDINNVPIRIYSTLRELEIFGIVGDGQEFVGLDAMFRHAMLLESLSVVGFIDPIFFSFLPHWSTNSLPRLTSFRLSVEVPSAIGEDEFCSLTGFLHGRKSLRRLYLRHPEMRFNQTSRLLSVIQELNEVEVLGVHMGADVFAGNAALAMVANSLPSNLRALHLAINWGGDDLLLLMDQVSSLPKLSFLHLYGTVTRLPISVEEIATEGKGLDTIGLNRALWSIERSGPDQELGTTKWPRWKIKFCIEDEFVNADDYWLFKYN